MGDVRADLEETIHLLAGLVADDRPLDKNAKISEGMKRYWAEKRGTAVLEKNVEGVLVAEVKAAGGVALKILPSVAGMPDRLVLLPQGNHHLVELKQVGEHPTKIQRQRHRELMLLGHPVTVLRGSDKVREWVHDRVS